MSSRRGLSAFLDRSGSLPLTTRRTSLGGELSASGASSSRSGPFLFLPFSAVTHVWSGSDETWSAASVS
jgi:hypothetical protein